MSSDPSPSPRRRGRLAAGILALAVLGLLALLLWLGGTASGARAALAALASASGGSMRVGEVSGRLAGPLQLQQLTLQSAGMEIRLQDIRLDWRPQALLQGQLHVTALRVGELRIDRRIGQPSAPAALPASLSLPLQVRVDSAQVDRGKLNWGALNVIDLGGFALRLDYDGARYQVALDRFTASTAMDRPDAGGKTRADSFRASLRGEAELADTAPYALSGVFNTRTDTQLGAQRLSGAGQVQLGGSLAQLQTGIDFAFGAATLKGRATLRPFSDSALGDTEIRARGLDLAVFGAGLPRTRIDAVLAANSAGGSLTLSNAEAGAYDAARLPLRTLSTRFRQDAEGLHLDAIAAALGSAKEPAGELQGGGRLFRGALNLALTTAALDLHRLDTRLLTTRLAGSAGIRHEAGRQEFNLELSEPLQNRRLALSAQATLENQALTLERAELKLGDGNLRASGNQQLGGKREFAASGTIRRFRPQDLGQFAGIPELFLNGEFSVRGALVPQPTASLDFRIADSRLAGQPLQGEGQARLRADSLDIPKLMLAAGANRLEVAGQLQPDRGELTFSLAAPRLEQLGPGFAGTLQAAGTARGSFAHPDVALQWQASRLRLPNLLQVDNTRGSGALKLDRKAPWMLGSLSLDATAQGLRNSALQVDGLSATLRFAPPANAPLVLQLRAQKIALPDYHADSLGIDVGGSTGRHTVTAELALPQQQWRLQATGALQAQEPRWQGSIEQLGGSGRLQARLAAPAPLEISPQRIELRQFLLNAEGALLAIEQFRRDESGLQTRGRLEHLPLAMLLPYLRPQPEVSTDLVLGGEWDLALAGAPRGTLQLRRERGDLSMRGAAPVTLGLSRLEARANAAGGKLQLELHAEGASLGSIDVDAGLAMAGAGGLGILPQSALSGSARIAVPSLRWAAPLIAPGAIAEGSVEGELKLAGSLGQPRLAGQVNGRRLRLALPDLGVDLRGGSLEASFQDTRLLLQNLAFTAGGGQLSVSGPIDLAGAQPDVQLAIKAERYPLLTRSDRKLVLSGSGAVSLREGRLQATGGFSADSGMIDLGHADKPSLSDDVVIAGQTSKKAVTPLALDVVIGLGEGVTVRGHGLNAVLVGQVQFKSDAGEALKAQGAMRIVRGTFAAYGRELAIEKGLLYFNGAPGNPGLDILAMRRGQPVEAGVAVLGTALAPRIVLVSEPAVADAEKLSWLVLGRGLDAATGGGDLAALQSAAGSLLGQGAAAGVQAGIASAFGLDQLSLGTSSDSLQQRIITVGKQVSSRLRVGIEQGLESASSVLQLRYTISRKLTLEIDTGTRTAFSVFYNFAFD